MDVHAVMLLGRSRIYPYSTEHKMDAHPQLRTHTATLDHSKAAEESYSSSNRKDSDVIKGVKEISIMFGFPTYDVIRGTTTDYMHRVLLGVIKIFLELWVDVAHKDQPWSVCKAQTTVNDRLH